MDFMQTLILTIVASGGFWALLQYVLQKRSQRKNGGVKDILEKLDRIEEKQNNQQAQLSKVEEGVRGSLFDRIKYLGEKYIEAGHITSYDYENFYKYLYEPYKKLGGDGIVDKIMVELNKLKIGD